MNTIPAPLANKVALVTGGSRSIGAGIARKLVEQGCSHIAITYNTNKAQADETLSSLQRVSPKLQCFGLSADLLDPNFGENVTQQTLAGLKTSHIDIVIACAANADTDTFSPVSSMPKSEFDSIITANAWSPLSLARAAMPHMRSGGRIIFVSSVSSKTAQGDPFIGYAASKAALDAISRGLAATWSAKYDVTVNTVSVGATNSEMLRKSIKNRGMEFDKATKDFSLLKRHGEIEEVAAIVAFVASPDAGWIVGNQIPANGGGLTVLQS